MSTVIIERKQIMFGKKRNLNAMNEMEPTYTDEFEDASYTEPELKPEIDPRIPEFDPGFEPTENSIKLLLLNEEKEILTAASFYLPLEKAIRTAAIGARNYPGARYITALHTTWTADINNDWQVFNE